MGRERLEGFEALIRWNHPSRGLVPPDKFIALAEESGFIVPLGRWVLQEATRQLASWSRSLGDDRPLTMAINVSARQIRDWHLPDDIHDAIAAAGIAPERIVLEITESMLLHDPKAVAVVLRSLKATGVRIAIDDFGTGYSSLSVLQDLPIDILKIDKAFVSPPDESATNGHKVLGAILTLAQTLGLQTVAEGVELPDQAALLTAGGCDIGQGFFWARPSRRVRRVGIAHQPQPGAAGRAGGDHNFLAVGSNVVAVPGQRRTPSGIDLTCIPRATEPVTARIAVTGSVSIHNRLSYCETSSRRMMLPCPSSMVVRCRCVPNQPSLPKPVTMSEATNPIAPTIIRITPTVRMLKPC